MKQLKLMCVVVLVLAAVVAEGKPPTKRRPPPPPPPPKPLEVPVLDLDGPGSTGEKYSFFIAHIERQLRLTTTTPFIKNRPVLGEQKYNAVCLNVVIRGDGKSSTLTLRTDTIYFVGFKIEGGSSYAFKGDERFVTGSRSLGFQGDYSALVGGHANLGGVVIGQKAAQEALDILAGYSRATPEAEIKKALTRFVVMICEATRFAPIRAAVKGAWEQGGTFPKVGVELVVLWRDTSCAILVWNRNKGEGWSEIKEVKEKKLEEEGDPLMKTGDEAVKNVCVLLRPKVACSDGQTAAEDY
ncbi:hypothetical protein ACQ4PT_005267 [Festuca glaucescens]